MKKKALVLGALMVLSQSVFAGSKIDCAQPRNQDEQTICQKGQARISQNDLLGACNQAGGSAMAALARHLYKTTSDSNVRVDVKLTGLYDQLIKQSSFELTGLIQGKKTADVILKAQKKGETCQVSSLEVFTD